MSSNFGQVLKAAATFSVFVGAWAATQVINAQTTVALGPLVIEQRRMELVSPSQNPSSARITQVNSSNPSVATVTVYREKQVQVVAVAPGSTTITFFDAAARVTYRMQVSVTAPNMTGGGGQGYDPHLNQLADVVMQPKYTRNVASPGKAPHNINGVASSNPSVATARTDTAGQIQVYAQALGDTFIQFTDNGKTYQFHVWVRNDASAINGGNGNNGNKGGNGNPNPTPNPNPNPKPPAGGDNGERLDPCLVGSWRSTSMTSASAFTVTGGSGIAVTINSNRTISINYSGMQPETQTNPIGQTVQVQSWSGTADGHIATKGGAILIKSVDDSNIQRSLTVYGRTTTNPLKTLGPMLIPQPYLTSYSCSDNHLSITLSAAGAFLNKFELDRQ